VTPEGYNSRLDEAVIVFGQAAPDNHSTHGSRPELWPTPAASNPNEGETLESWNRRQAQNKEKHKNGNGAGTPLAIKVQMECQANWDNGKLNHGSRPELWRTPSAQIIDAKSGEIKLKNRKPEDPQVGLADQVKAWATPKASDPQHAGPNMRDSAGNYALPAQAVRESWATPQTRDNRSGGAERWDDPNRSKNLNDQIAATTMQNAKLNPRWVETLMGLPVGWTMPSCVSPVTIELTNSDF
jgi:hypothetical protein